MRLGERLHRRHYSKVVIGVVAGAVAGLFIGAFAFGVLGYLRVKRAEFDRRHGWVLMPVTVAAHDVGAARRIVSGPPPRAQPANGRPAARRASLRRETKVKSA